MNAPLPTRPAPATAKPDRLLVSMTREHGFEPLRIEGTLPAGLRGELHRVGPGLFELGDAPYGHPFEGDGALCSVRIADGKAQGAHRVVQSEGLKAERRAGQPLFGSAASWPRRLKNGVTLQFKNAANTNTMVWQNRLFALFEPSLPTELSTDLDTLGETRLGGAIPGAFSAHPHRVEAHRTLYNFGVRYGRQCKLDLFALPDEGRARRLATLPLEVPVMLHDFIATERHLLFFVAPTTLRMGRALLGLNPFVDLIGWRPERGTEVIVVPLDDPSRPTRFFVDAFFQWHFANAFEDDGAIVVDLLRYPNFDTFGDLEAGVRHIDGGKLVRAKVDVARRRVDHEVLDTLGSEFPRIDPRVQGARHTRVWAAQGRSVSQHDVQAGTRQVFDFGAGAYASEAVFVPRDADAPEGDGFALSLVYDRGAEASYVAVLDTAHFDEGPVARLWFDHHVPVTFHGNWLDR